MKALARLVLAVAHSALAGCAESGSARPPVTPAATIVGEPQSCVSLAQLRETRVRDDWTIDFIGNGGQVWRNTLTSRCSGLKVNNAITYEVSLSQLCSPDLVYVLETAGGLHRGVACGLGQFVPVKLQN